MSADKGDEPIDLEVHRQKRQKQNRPAGPERDPSHATLRQKLRQSDDGSIYGTHSNLAMILKLDTLIADAVHYNEFTAAIELQRPFPVIDESLPAAPGPFPRALADDDVTRILAYLQHVWSRSFRRTAVDECLATEARDRRHHPVCDWLTKQEWDGRPRLSGWLSSTFGCPQDEYHRAVGAKTLIAAVRRVRQPGCKFDHMLVLEGPQGIGKSRAIALLFGPDWSTDQISDLSKKDSAIDLRGKWGVELSEIEHVIRADVETVKAFLSRSVDHYRAPYARTSLDVPRQCVLIGSTNATGYLRDETGNRRIWPAKCLHPAVDLDWLATNRDQLWAEAADREAAGMPIWIDDTRVQEAAAEAQACRIASDPWADLVLEYTEKKEEEWAKWNKDGKPTWEPPMPDPFAIRSADILKNAIGLTERDWTRANEMRVGKILRTNGWQTSSVYDRDKKKTVQKWLRETL